MQYIKHAELQYLISP